MGKFTIKKGNHSSGWAIGITFGNEVRFTATFDSSCLYSVEDWEDRDKRDINKMYGFTNGLSENDSARFGWRCLDGLTLQIVTYVHDAGPFVPNSEVVLGTVMPGEQFSGRIRNVGNQYIFNFNNGPDVVIQKSTSPAWIKFMLKFYFGGNNTAPHDMFVTIN
jgi:hypothetical protein